MTENLTREQFDALKVRLNKDTNVDTTEDTFQGSLDGVTIKVTYIEPVATITIIKKPFFISEALIEHKIQTYLAGE